MARYLDSQSQSTYLGNMEHEMHGADHREQKVKDDVEVSDRSFFADTSRANSFCQSSPKDTNRCYPEIRRISEWFVRRHAQLAVNHVDSSTMRLCREVYVADAS